MKRLQGEMCDGQLKSGTYSNGPKYQLSHGIFILFGAEILGSNAISCSLRPRSIELNRVCEGYLMPIPQNIEI